MRHSEPQTPHTAAPLPLVESGEYPMITFPSGERFALKRGQGEQPLVTIYSGMDLPLFDQVESAYMRACWFSTNSWFDVFRHGSQLEIWSDKTDEVFVITYDPEAGWILDIEVQAA